MANARPFSTSTFQDLSNDTKNTPRRGVLPPAVEPWTFRSLGGLQILHFPSVGLHPHTWPKWGCDTPPPHKAKKRATRREEKVQETTWLKWSAFSYIFQLTILWSNNSPCHWLSQIVILPQLINGVFVVGCCCCISSSIVVRDILRATLSTRAHAFSISTDGHACICCLLHMVACPHFLLRGITKASLHQALVHKRLQMWMP
jgi:hypothetical protein